MRRFFSSIIMAVATLICVGCQNSKKADRQAEELTFACEKFDTVAYYGKDANGPKCTISISLHHAMGPNAHIINDSILKCGIFLDEELRRGEKKTVPKAIKIVVKNHIKGFKNDVKEMKEDGAGYLEALANCYFNVESQYAKTSDTIINYQVKYDSYLGGAHGSSNTFYLNFDPRSGKMYRTSDIMNSGAEDRLSAAIALRIAQNHGYGSVEELTDNEGIFDIFEPYVPDNFVIGNDSITFIYQCEEVGPYAVGEIQSKFAYTELQGLIKIKKPINK